MATGQERSEAFTQRIGSVITTSITFNYLVQQKTAVMTWWQSYAVVVGDVKETEESYTLVHLLF